ncbi:MAG: DUF3027 domain-containing protein, partial [Alphaproteobacteria bacterium]
MVDVTIDEARIVRLKTDAAEIIVGNPAIADVVAQSARLLVVTGKSYGSTNVIALDASGREIYSARLGVKGNNTRIVRLYKGTLRQSLHCAPGCQRTLAIGDDKSQFEQVADTGTVGDHLGVSGDGERLVTHRFACLSRGYRGWHWAVTLARAPRSRTATVCETVLVPGPEAILAPAWVPWSDRLEPGDLGPTDVLPYRPDDPNLEPGFGQADDDDGNDRLAVWELGLGRTRVLGPQGRGEAATRWYTGARGPTADEAVHAAAACS